MKRLCLAAFCWISVVTASKAQSNYNVALIPRELLSHASAVVRNDELNVTVEDINSTIVYEKTAVTVLNRNGDEMAEVDLDYDKSKVIKYVRGTIYNEFGKPVHKFSLGDFEDNSSWDGISLFSDTRIKHYSPPVTAYPYTMAIEYVVRLKQTLNLPEWDPVKYFGIAVEKSSFTLTCKPDFNIRYKETN